MKDSKVVFSGYFHEDWRSEFDSWQAAIDAFIFVSSAEKIREAILAIRELEGMLPSMYLKPDFSDWLLKEWGIFYSPGPLLADYMNWLISVRERLGRACS